jgi:hypothetical protein
MLRQGEQQQLLQRRQGPSIQLRTAKDLLLLILNAGKLLVHGICG